jgi:transcriptional regulator with XRE-family HTH domain
VRVSIGARFFEVRRGLGLHQADVAAEIGISQAALVNYEKGTRDPPASAILAFAKFYKVSAAWLLTGEGRPDQTSLDETYEISIDTAWDFLARGGDPVDKESLIKLAGALFQYLLEHGTISETMSEKLLSLSA